MVKDGLDALRKLMPFLAGRLTLADFTRLAVAAGAVGASPPLPQGDVAGVVRQVGGNVSEAARLLGVCPKTVYRKLKAAGLSPDSLRTSTGPA